MQVNVSLLREAKLENVERLARWLNVSLDGRSDSVREYHQELAWAIAQRIRRDALVDELERGSDCFESVFYD